MADGTEEYGVVGTELLEAVLWHHPASLEVVVRPPRKLVEAPLDPVLLAGRREDLQRLADHLDADPVTSDHRDSVLAHRPTLGPGSF